MSTLEYLKNSIRYREEGRPSIAKTGHATKTLKKNKIIKFKKSLDSNIAQECDTLNQSGLHKNKLMDHLEDFQKLVIANAARAKGLKLGEMAPDFTLCNAFGDEVTLSKLLTTSTVILKFYRGEWCPICNLDLREIQRFVPQFDEFEAKVVAISPQKPDHALMAVKKGDLNFEVLSDPDQKVIQSFKLQFDPGEDYHKRRDLALLNGNGLKTLPVPATFIINKNRIIEALHVEANYTQRMGALEILKVLEDLRRKSS